MPSNPTLLRPLLPLRPGGLSATGDLAPVPDRPRRPRRRPRRWLIAVTAAAVLGAGLPVLVAHSLLEADRERRARMEAAQPTPIGYWPSAANTGVPPGTTLRASGSLTLRTAGQTISNLDINGCVRVQASNVRILRSRIRCSSWYGIFTASNVRNLVIEDVEINGMGVTSVGVCCSYYTLRRAHIHRTIDAVRLGNSTTLVDSYIHTLARPPGSHSDTLQTTGGVGIVVRHNTLLPYNPVTRDRANACLMIGSELAPAVRDLLMVDNYCDGGNWSIGVRTDLVASNIVFRGNKFGRNYQYGVIARPRQAGITWESNNVFFDNGAPVVR